MTMRAVAIACAILVQAASMPAGISRVALVENASIMSARLTYAPGASETIHTHPFAAVVVQLTPGDVEMTISGQTTTQHRDAGFAWFIPRGAPHRLVNTGTSAFDQITIALKPDRPAATPGPATIAPPGITRTTLIDNDETRVVRVEFSPSGREPVHEHPYDLVTVQLTPGRLEILEGRDKTRAVSSAGTVKFLPRQVPHSYASADKKPFSLLSITVK